MLHLLTGANGTGKTLFTLRWVRDLQLKAEKAGTPRPVFYNGRFKLKPEIAAEFGWEKFEFKDWEKLPDCSICIVDECHKDLPPMNAASEPPSHIKELAEHRSRGFDFFFMTQHPKNTSGFMTRLIGAPGWHRHLKRLAGAAPVVNCFQWDSVDDKPERFSAKLTADVTKRKFPKEVYNWYDSAVMHTGKFQVPTKVWLFLLVLVALCYFGYSVSNRFDEMKGTEEETEAPKPAAIAAAPGQKQAFSASHEPKPMSTAEYLASYQPRVPDLPHTAPRYDEITKPDAAPYPAACLAMADRCECYTQQGTKMAVQFDMCKTMVKQGYFKDWGNNTNQQSQQAGLLSPSS